MDRIKFRGDIPDKSPRYKELDSSSRTSGCGLPLLAMPSILCTECITYFLVFFFLFELAMIRMLHHARISSVDYNPIEFRLGSWSSKNLEYHRHHNCHSRQSRRPSPSQPDQVPCFRTERQSFLIHDRRRISRSSSHTGQVDLSRTRRGANDERNSGTCTSRAVESLKLRVYFRLSDQINMQSRLYIPRLIERYSVDSRDLDRWRSELPGERGTHIRISSTRPDFNSSWFCKQSDKCTYLVLRTTSSAQSTFGSEPVWVFEFSKKGWRPTTITLLLVDRKMTESEKCAKK